MKIKKVEDKPMVIHTKKEPKLHLHTKKKAVIKKKVTPTSVTVERKKARSGIKKKMEESGQSIKVRKESLRTMAGIGIRAGAEQIEGGEEIKDSIDLLAVTSAPALGAVSQGAGLYRRKREENRRKRKSREKEKAEYASDFLHVRKNVIEHRKDKRGKSKRNREDVHKGEGKHKSGVNHIVRGRMIDSFLEKFQSEREEQKNIITSTKEAAKVAAMLLAKQVATFLAPILLGLFALVSVEVMMIGRAHV